MKTRMLVMALVFCLTMGSVAAAPPATTFTIRYALVSGGQDPHLPYMHALLQLACSKAAVHCELQPAYNMNQGRALVQLEQKNGQVDIFWGMTDKEREQRLLPVRVPLYKGLIGWRVMLLSAERQDLLKDIHDRKALSRLRAGQAKDWPDTAILQQAGLPVVLSPNYTELFAMLRLQRYDYFPRSVIEVNSELHSGLAKGLVLDPYVVLHYPAAFYFFVSPREPHLAQVLTNGLEMAQKDGSFERLFLRYNQDNIRSLNLNKRVVIHLDNPFLPEATPLARRELWYRTH